MTRGGESLAGLASPGVAAGVVGLRLAAGLFGQPPQASRPCGIHGEYGWEASAGSRRRRTPASQPRAATLPSSDGSAKGLHSSVRAEVLVSCRPISPRPGRVGGKTAKIIFRALDLLGRFFQTPRKYARIGITSRANPAAVMPPDGCGPRRSPQSVGVTHFAVRAATSAACVLWSWRTEADVAATVLATSLVERWRLAPSATARACAAACAFCRARPVGEALQRAARSWRDQPQRPGAPRS